MKALDGFRVGLLVGFALITISESGFSESKYQFPGGKWNVRILNRQTDSALNLHCRSKSDDLGVHVVGIGDQYEWGFKENFWQTTLFWCDFQSKHGKVSFEVFWPEKGSWLQERCDYENCIWAARNDGFYLANIPTGIFEFLHPWGR